MYLGRNVFLVSQKENSRLFNRLRRTACSPVSQWIITPSKHSPAPWFIALCNIQVYYISKVWTAARYSDVAVLLKRNHYSKAPFLPTKKQNKKKQFHRKTLILCNNLKHSRRNKVDTEELLLKINFKILWERKKIFSFPKN